MSAKKLLVVLGTVLALASSNANAWFFFFIPGSVTSKIGDALSGAEGENCVAETAKIGDVITSQSGNTARIKSLSGTSTRCQTKELPIRALMEFTYNFSSKAGLEIPDGYEQRLLTDIQRFHGFLVKAEHPVKRSGFMVSTRKRDNKTDPAAVARSISESMSRMILNATTAHEEELTINGMKALRFEVTGKNKGIFGQTFTYVVTVLVGANELVTINAWAPVDDYATEKDALKQLSVSVKDLNEPMDVAKPAEPLTFTPTLTEVGRSPVTVPSVLPAVQTASAPALTPAPAPVLPVTAPISADVSPNTSTDSTVRKLREIGKLYKEGILNQNEYESKKKELLKAL